MSCRRLIGIVDDIAEDKTYGARDSSRAPFQIMPVFRLLGLAYQPEKATIVAGTTEHAPLL